MQASVRAIKGGLMLYDAAEGGKIHDHVFAPAYWRARDALSEPLGGRGAAWRITAGDIDWVLRFYRRGGLPGKVLLDWYLFTGMDRSRPFLEWHLLKDMHDAGLPVPRPVAARVIRYGLGYRGAIITATVPGESLARLLIEERLTAADWQATGYWIRKFHDSGVWHADLNAHNVLIQQAELSSKVHLIDFDRGRFRPQDTGWREGNLSRLRRSLAKVAPDREALIEAGWAELRKSYDEPWEYQHRNTS